MVPSLPDEKFDNPFRRWYQCEIKTQTTETYLKPQQSSILENKPQFQDKQNSRKNTKNDMIMF